MPSKRNYKEEYAKYGSKTIAERSQRNKARREYEKKHGNLPSTVDVDHVVPVRKGGGNTGNTRAVTQSKNSAWRKGKKGYD